MRIPLLLPVWTILLLGWITGSSEAQFSWAMRHGLPRFGQAGPAVLLLALSGFSFIVAAIYIMNQIADVESDRINHKLFLLPHGILSIRTAWVITFVCLTIGISLGALAGTRFLVVFGLSIVLGTLYNFPPASLKDRAWGGVAANCLGHGLLTYFVGWLAAKSGQELTVGVLSEGLISAVSPTLANGAVFLATTIPDVQGDAATGKRTFCVRYGPRTTARMAALLCLGAFVSAFAMEYNGWVMIAPAGVSLMLFGWLAITGQALVAFRTFRWPVVLLSVTVFLMVPLYGILVAGTFLISRMYYRYRFGIRYPTLSAQ